MAYIQVEASVRTHPKFLKAGPAPSWLWLCGLAYCQEGLTDGFIPTEAIPYLGVKNAHQLAAHLVKAGLWHEVDGGWAVHDYLEHNRSSAQVAVLKERRGAGGKLGGRPQKTSKVIHTETLKVSDQKTLSETLPKTFPDLRCTASASVVSSEERLDVAFASFRDAYPAARRKGGFLVQQQFLAAVAAAGHSSKLMEALVNHRASEQWSNPAHIPGMDVWLNEERWRQELPPPAAASSPYQHLPEWARKAKERELAEKQAAK